MSQGAAPDGQARPHRVDRRWALIALVIVVVLVTASAGVYLVIGGGSAQPSASPGNLSAYGQLFAQVGPNGEVTKEMALEAFSLAIAPLPGVTVPTGAAANDEERMDGTFAVDWIRPYIDQLTPDQAAVVKAALTPDPKAPVFSPEPNAGSGLDIELASATQGDLATYANNARKAIGANLHQSLSIDWSVTLNATDVKVGDLDALAYADGVYDSSNNRTGCAIFVNPALYNSADLVLVEVAMAHEMFHCFQNDWLIKQGKADAIVPA